MCTLRACLDRLTNEPNLLNLYAQMVYTCMNVPTDRMHTQTRIQVHLDILHIFLVCIVLFSPCTDAPTDIMHTETHTQVHPNIRHTVSLVGCLVLLALSPCTDAPTDIMHTDRHTGTPIT